MKCIYYFFCFFLIKSYKINAQSFSSNCAITPAIINLYKTDVTRLCIARLNETNSTYKDSIEIPQDIYDTVMRAFAIMHNLQNSSITDTIKNLFQFENFTAINQPHCDDSYEDDSSHVLLTSTGIWGSAYKESNKPRIFEVHIDSNTLWAKDWVNGNFTNTSYPLMNQFVQQYNFSITKLPYTFFGQYFFYLKTNMLKNISALSKAIPSFSSFGYVQPLKYIGDGNIINFEFKNAGILATYHNGCGDCLSGCNYWEDWQFFIPYDSCNVNFVGLVDVHPNPLTAEVGCLRGPIVVPIEFGNILPYRQGKLNQINFTVLTEVDIRYYKLEKSSNARDFVLINSIAANNKNNSNYTVSDENPFKGNNYYRIEAIGNNGEKKYSSTVLVKNEETKLTIYPNPSKDIINIECNDGIKEVKLFNAMGKHIATGTNLRNDGNLKLQTLNLQQVSKGLYLVKVLTNKNEINNVKLVVE